MFTEFKEFIARGNVMELAVGVIIAGAFATVVSSLTGDVLMPVIGFFAAGIDFSELALTLGAPRFDADGEVIAGTGVQLTYGNFIQTVIDFLILAFVVFLLVEGYNDFLRKKDAEPDEVPPAPSKEEALLTEIRDLLARR